MANQKAQFLSPVGRLVWGSIYEPKTKDSQGNPLVVKKGAEAGKPTQRFEFGVAFAKTPGATSWTQESWMAIFYQTAQASWPQGQFNSPTFSWKIVDGDSQIPNAKGRKPCDQEGQPGHWVVAFSSSFAPKVCNKDGSAYLLEKDSVKLGDYVQVHGTCDGNGNSDKPGIYINHNAVSLQGTGQEIVKGPDLAAIGFGKAAAPAGMQPLGPGGLPIPSPSFVPPVGIVPPPAFTPPVAAPPAALPPPALPVQPHHAFLTPPALPVAPTAPPPPAMAAPAPPRVACPLGAPAGHQMTAKTSGVRYDSFRAQGWTDDMLIAGGYMVRL